MSRLLPILLILTLLDFAACRDRSGDDDNHGDSSLTEADFIGSWTISAFTSDYTETGTFLGQDLDESGTIAISDSDLQLDFEDNGQWSSSGSYTLTEADDSDSDVTQQEGIGSGSWSYRNDSLQMDGLVYPGSKGTFADSQFLSITNFSRDLEIDISGIAERTDTDEDRDIEIVTRNEWRILLMR